MSEEIKGYEIVYKNSVANVKQTPYGGFAVDIKRKNKCIYNYFFYNKSVAIKAIDEYEEKANTLNDKEFEDLFDKYKYCKEENDLARQDLMSCLKSGNDKKYYTADIKPKQVDDPVSYIFNKYRDEYDYISDVEDVRDYLNRIYEEKGFNALDDFFTNSASKEYIADYLSLVHIDKYENQKNDLNISKDKNLTR